MNIDTLILSGGSIKGLSFLGSIKYLVEHNYIDSNFKNIKKIICVSASFLFILILILLEYDYNNIENIMINFDYKEFLDMDDLSIKSFINEYGFINYHRTHIYIQKLLKEKYNVESISLLKLYKISGIHIIVKVVNVTNDKIEYIDHINNPKINILKLIQMTTCIPLLIKPVKYKNNLYLDGGLSGNCPIEINDSGNYLCIEIYGEKYRKINNLLDYIIKGWKMYSPDILIRKYDKNNIKINLTKLNIYFTDFDINNDMKKKLLKEGYEQTKLHFDKYN